MMETDGKGKGPSVKNNKNKNPRSVCEGRGRQTMGEQRGGLGELSKENY